MRFFIEFSYPIGKPASWIGHADSVCLQKCKITIIYVTKPLHKSSIAEAWCLLPWKLILMKHIFQISSSGLFIFIKTPERDCWLVLSDNVINWSWWSLIKCYCSVPGSFAQREWSGHWGTNICTFSYLCQTSL